MNYELKHIRPGSVFCNVIRASLIIGFCTAIVRFLTPMNQTIQLTTIMQKVMATILFTGVYSFVVSTLLLAIVLLYNLWTQEFSIKTFFIQSLLPTGILGLGMGVVSNFAPATAKGFLARILGSILFAVIFSPLSSVVITGTTAIFFALGIRTKGITLHLEQE